MSLAQSVVEVHFVKMPTFELEITPQLCVLSFFFFHSRIKSDFVSFLSVNAPSPSAFQLVSSKEKQEISLKALPPPPPSRSPSYHLSSDQSVFVFGRLDINPLHFFFIFFFENGHLLGPVMTPAGQLHLRPGCTYPKESGQAARITGQRCNKALLTGKARCPRHSQVRSRT